MKVIKRTALLLSFGAMTACTHLQYDYYIPSGAGVVVSDLSGGTTSGPPQFVMLNREEADYFLSAVEHEANGKAQLGFVILRRSDGYSVTELVQFFNRAIEIKIADTTHRVADVRIVSESPKRVEGSIRFTDVSDFGSSFVLRFRREGEDDDVVEFTRSHADYIHMPSQLQ